MHTHHDSLLKVVLRHAEPARLLPLRQACQEHASLPAVPPGALLFARLPKRSLAHASGQVQPHVQRTVVAPGW
jgi:hypothetical protein